MNEKSLVEIMLPESLDEFAGQSHILGKGKFLYTAISKNKITSLIMYGPPGTGKTALANIIAHQNHGIFHKMNAVINNVSDVKKLYEKAKIHYEGFQQKTILFLDEIHRFNKLQQDTFLPMLENNFFILTAATTENPYVSLNNALISRSLLAEFRSLTEEDLRKVFKNIEHKLSEKININDEALESLIHYVNGDARRLIKTVDILKDTYNNEEITLSHIKDIIPGSSINYDRQGDMHYDIISAFIKSIRGSEVNAALYWLAAMLKGGENPDFIARRLVISASEDIGNADPQAILIAEAALRSIQHIGMPEAQLILSQAVIYLSLAPKSNSAATAIGAALKDIEENGIEDVPSYLKSQSYRQSKDKSYKYPHDYPYHFVKQNYTLNEKDFFKPGNLGFEKQLLDRLKWLKKLKNKK